MKDRPRHSQMLNHSNSKMSNLADAVVVGYAAPETGD